MGVDALNKEHPCKRDCPNRTSECKKTCVEFLEWQQKYLEEHAHHSETKDDVNQYFRDKNDRFNKAKQRAKKRRQPKAF